MTNTPTKDFLKVGHVIVEDKTWCLYGEKNGAFQIKQNIGKPSKYSTEEHILEGVNAISSPENAEPRIASTGFHIRGSGFAFEIEKIEENSNGDLQINANHIGFIGSIVTSGYIGKITMTFGQSADVKALEIGGEILKEDGVKKSYPFQETKRVLA